MQRGFLRIYLLKLIEEAGEEGISGYSLMKQIEERTGFWRPSPGSIYPLLGALEEAGVIEHRAEKGKKVYFLTDKGRAGLAQAKAVKEETMEGVRRSIRVLGELFGEDVVDDLSAHLERRHRLPPSGLRSALSELHLLLGDILSQELPPKKAERIERIIRRTIEELRDEKRD